MCKRRRSAVATPVACSGSQRRSGWRAQTDDGARPVAGPPRGVAHHGRPREGHERGRREQRHRLDQRRRRCRAPAGDAGCQGGAARPPGDGRTARRAARPRHADAALVVFGQLTHAFLSVTTAPRWFHRRWIEERVLFTSLGRCGRSRWLAAARLPGDARPLPGVRQSGTEFLQEHDHPGVADVRRGRSRQVQDGHGDRRRPAAGLRRWTRGAVERGELVPKEDRALYDMEVIRRGTRTR